MPHSSKPCRMRTYPSRKACKMESISNTNSSHSWAVERHVRASMSMLGHDGDDDRHDYSCGDERPAQMANEPSPPPRSKSSSPPPPLSSPVSSPPALMRVASATKASLTGEPQPANLWPGSQNQAPQWIMKQPPRNAPTMLLPPQQFSVPDVSFWLTQIGMATLVPVFQKHKIDGEQLCSMAGYDFVNDLQCMPYQANKIQRELEHTIWNVMARQRQLTQLRQQQITLRSFRNYDSCDNASTSSPRTSATMDSSMDADLLSLSPMSLTWDSEDDDDDKSDSSNDAVAVSGQSNDSSHKHTFTFWGDGVNNRNAKKTKRDSRKGDSERTSATVDSCDQYSRELDELIDSFRVEQQEQEERFAQFMHSGKKRRMPFPKKRKIGCNQKSAPSSLSPSSPSQPQKRGKGKSSRMRKALRRWGIIR